MINLNADTDVANVHSVVAAGAVLVDVREPDEFAEGTIDGAVNVPLGEVEERMVFFDKNVPIAFLCRSGNRSGKAAELYREAGFKAVNLRGGRVDVLLHVARGVDHHGALRRFVDDQVRRLRQTIQIELLAQQRVGTQCFGPRQHAAT